jgi:hypothetical protein
MRSHVRMPWPPPVRVTLSPSRIASILIGAPAAITCGVVAILPLDPLPIALAIVAVIAWAFDRIGVVALRRGTRAVRQFELRGDLTLVAVLGDGSACAGRVHRDSYVGSRLTTIVWQPYGRWRHRAIVLLPDMLPRDDFRRLRVLLRYGRNDVAQGAPASHA